MVSTASSSIWCCSLSISTSSATTCRPERNVAADQRVDGIDDLPFGQAAHLGDQPRELLQIDVEGFCGVF